MIGDLTGDVCTFGKIRSFSGSAPMMVNDRRQLKDPLYGGLRKAIVNAMRVEFFFWIPDVVFTAVGV